LSHPELISNQDSTGRAADDRRGVERGSRSTRPLDRLPQALPGLSVVLPCVDEEANVARAVRAALATAARCAHEYEVIVVDDGSSGGTARVAAELAERDPHVRLLLHPGNRGYGAALRTGIEAARLGWVLITDADLQFDLRALEDFVPATRDAELVVGWRVLRSDGLHRRLNAALWNRLVTTVFRLPMRDVDCAFKLIRRELLVDAGLSCGGAAISTELLVKTLAAGARIEEIGVRHRPRVAGRSSGADPRVVLRALVELACLRRAVGPLPRGRRAA